MGGNNFKLKKQNMRITKFISLLFALKTEKIS